MVTQPLAGRNGGSLELRPQLASGIKFAGIAFVAVLWNGAVWIFVALALAKGGGREAFTGFLGIVVLLGLGLIYGAFRQYLVLLNPPLRLTLTPDTLIPGESFSLQWRLGGQSERVKRLTIVLEGREEAEYQRGTDTSTETSVFASVTLVDTQQEARILAGVVGYVVPPDIMPTFKARHNKIYWALKAHSFIPGRPDSEDEYEVPVGPRRKMP